MSMFFVRVILGQLALFDFLKIENWALHTLDFHLLSGLKKWQHQKSESNLLSACNPVYFRVGDSHKDYEQLFIFLTPSCKTRKKVHKAGKKQRGRTAGNAHWIYLTYSFNQMFPFEINVSRFWCRVFVGCWEQRLLSTGVIML